MASIMWMMTLLLAICYMASILLLAICYDDFSGECLLHNQPFKIIDAVDL
jgi:hypothetical protein